MKRLFLQTMALLSIAAMAFLTGSCKKEEVAKDATVGIKVTATTTSSITFELSSTDAVKVSYQVSAAEAAGAYTDVEVTGDDPVSVTVSELQENTEYTIRANATNRDGKVCPDVTATATTTTNASVSVEVKSWTSSSVTFAINPVNAVSYSYAVVESTAKPDEAELTEKVESGQAGEYTVEGLKENTSYTVVAAAVNASGDESPRAYGSFKTEVEPDIDITSIIPDSKQVSVVLSTENAIRYAYAVVPEGVEVPDRETFLVGDFSGKTASLIVSDLQPETAYILYVYGINAKEYEGIIVSEKFSTLEFVQKPFEIAVSNITSTDANIEVSFDKEQYSRYYFVAGPSSTIGDVKNWDWESVISSGWSNPMYGEYDVNMSTTLRLWRGLDGADRPLKVGELYMTGGVPVTIDGTIDVDAAVWTSIQLKPMQLGESEITCQINEVAVGTDRFIFNVTTSDPENTECFYMGKFYEEEITDYDEIVERIPSSVLINKPRYNFAADTVVSGFKPDSPYTFVVVPKDKEGRLGKVTSVVMRTRSIDYEGDVVCEVSMKDIDIRTASFDCIIPEGTEKILYHYADMKSNFNRESFEKSLKVNNKKCIESSGTFTIENLDSDTEYIFGFAPVDKYGVVGKCVYIEEKTLPYAFDGNADAKVDITIISCVQNGSSYKVKIEAKPGSNVQKYYLTTKSSSDNLTQTQFVNGCVKGSYSAYTGDATIAGWGGNGLTVGAECVVWVFAIDQNGKYVPVAETKIDGTWN